MSARNMVSVFIPYRALKDFSETSYAFGQYKILRNSILVSCDLFVNVRAVKSLEEIFDRITNDYSDITQTFNYLGVLYCSKRKRDSDFNSLKFSDCPISFVLRLDNYTNALYLENICFKSLENKDSYSNQIILYDSMELTRSRMFLQINNSLTKDWENSFLFFLMDSLKNNEKYSKSLHEICNKQVFNCVEPSKNYFLSGFRSCYVYTASVLFMMISMCKNIVSSLPLWIPQSSFKIVTSTSVGRQLHQRLLHFEKITTELKTKDGLNLQSKNLISAILFDLLCGCLITFTFLQSNVPLLLFDLSIEQTNNLVNNLQKLIYWLMGAPAGLKLNIPLNSALGHFFLYHIYLWEAYMAVVLPVFTFVLKISIVIGILGMTFVLCLLSDLVSLATIHIYCFYGYAARLYGYQVIALSSLWRLFRGKKWNPLRQRVDSYTYDIHQLFLGTLIFTVLLFLLPTVMIYYLVFTCLRIMVLGIQGIISKVIQAINVNPLYCALSRIFGSSEVAGDVYFSVFSTSGTLTLSMQITQVSFMTVVKGTLPELNSNDEYLTWKDFLSSIVLGKIIYPL